MKSPMPAQPTNCVMPAEVHNAIVSAAYRHRGYTPDEADAAATFGEFTSRHGIKTHNAIKALHHMRVGTASPALLSMLRDERPEHRISAMWALKISRISAVRPARAAMRPGLGVPRSRRWT